MSCKSQESCSNYFFYVELYIDFVKHFSLNISHGKLSASLLPNYSNVFSQISQKFEELWKKTTTLLMWMIWWKQSRFKIWWQTYVRGCISNFYGKKYWNTFNLWELNQLWKNEATSKFCLVEEVLQHEYTWHIFSEHLTSTARKN